MLSGTYELEAAVSRRPLNALPSLLVLARDVWESPLVGLLANGRRRRSARPRRRAPAR
jgi:hypothetical protein